MIFITCAPENSDEQSSSKKLKLSDPGDLLSDAPMSADVNRSSGDMRVECMLERIERERVENKSSDTLLSRILGDVSDEQFLEAAGLDEPARSREAYDLLKLGQNLNNVHIAEIFSQPKTAATSCRMSLTPFFVFDMSRIFEDLNVWTNAGRLCEYLNRTTKAFSCTQKVQGVHGPAVDGPTKPKVPENP